jgi:hypothetical protein
MNRHPLLLGLLALALGALIGAGAAYFNSTNVGAAAPFQPTAPGTLAPEPVANREGITFSGIPQEPPVTPDLLSAGVPLVYAFYNLPETARSGISAAMWRLNGKSVGAVPRTDIQPDAGRPGHGTVLLRATKGKLPAGVYELELQTQRRRFRASFVAAEDASAVIAQQAPADAVLTIQQHVVARGVGDKGEPLRPTSRVGGKERVYYVLRYQGAEPGMAIGVTWWLERTEIKAVRREVVLRSTSGWAHAWLQADSGLPAGAYHVSATTAGDTQELARDQFTVR